MASVIDLLKNNSEFIAIGGIPRRKGVYTPSQNQTALSFEFKWAKQNLYEAPEVQQAAQNWLKERYSLPGYSISDLINSKKVLDAGCGSGFSALLLFGDALKDCEYIGADISLAVDIAFKRFAERHIPGQFIQASLTDLPEELGKFDVIFAEGVLHHTDSTKMAIKYLATKLNANGIFMFYVYRKKGPIREFTDDYIRSKLAKVSDEEAWVALEPLSKIGKILGDLNIEVNIEQPIDLLEIPSGKINLQRLFYWHIFKIFYREDWSLEEMNLVNFDWYRPLNCHRHTPEEIKKWVMESDLQILKIDIQEAGITVIAKRN